MSKEVRENKKAERRRSEGGQDADRRRKTDTMQTTDACYGLVVRGDGARWCGVVFFSSSFFLLFFSFSFWGCRLGVVAPVSAGVEVVRAV